jgi:hypothetical protein
MRAVDTPVKVAVSNSFTFRRRGRAGFCIRSEAVRRPGTRPPLNAGGMASERLMYNLLWSYWWIVFPIGAFVFGAWDRWLAYRRSRDQLELLKHYAAQGKDPPPELMDEMRGGPAGGGPGGPPWAYGDWGYSRRMRRAWRGYYRWGPYWQWRRVIVTGALAAGFWWASEYADLPGTAGPFRLVAVILTVVAAANLLSAVLFASLRDK